MAGRQRDRARPSAVVSGLDRPRSVQLPPLLEEHDVPLGLLKAASVVSLTVKDVDALDGGEKASIPGTAIIVTIASTAGNFEIVRRPHRVANKRLLDGDMRFLPD